jgi:hypothetical protein
MEVLLLRRQYTDGSLAVQMLRQTDGCWDFWGDVTVNLGNARDQNSSFAYVDTNNMPAVADFLVENGLADYTGMTRSSGFCTYPLYAFTPEFFGTCANTIEEVR